MKQSRVLHIQGRMGLGGAETFLMNSYRNIDRSKYQFHFVVYEDYGDVDVYFDEIEKLGGKVHITANPNNNLFKFQKDLKKIIKEDKIDIVHNQVFFGGGLNLRTAKKGGVPIAINHSHATGSGKNPIKKSLEPFFRFLNKKYSDFNFACSTEAGLALYGDQDFEIIFNGIDLSTYENAKSLDRLSFGIPENSLIVGAIGRLENQKNYPFMIEVARNLIEKNNNIYFLIIGEGSKQDEIQEQINKYGIGNNVKLIGTRRDIPEFLKMIDVFLMTSHYEGLPIVAVEAQASGAYLILSDRISKEVSLSDFVEFLSIDNEDYSAWSDRILAKKAARSSYIRTSKLQEYDMEHTAKQLEKVYDKLLRR